MILRLTASAALHGAAGVAMGVTGVLAACTVAQVAVVARRRMTDGRGADPFAAAPPAPQRPDPMPTNGLGGDPGA